MLKMDFQMMKKHNLNKIRILPPMTMIFENHLVITIPHSRVLKLLARSVLLALFIVAFPWIESFLPNNNNTSSNHSNQSLVSEVQKMDSSVSVISPLLFQDLLNEGLFKLGDKALFITSGNGDYFNSNSYQDQQILVDNDIDLISELDQERQSSIPDKSLDFVISSGFKTSEFVDRCLKIGGIVVVQLNNDISGVFQKPSSYKIVYLRRLGATVIAMRKISISNSDSPARRHLHAFESEAKRAALDGLEDVILEPPRGSSNVFRNYLKKTKYLPELTGDTLDGYPRRVFIDVALPGKSGDEDKSIEWFKKNYPTRNRVFDIFNIEMVAGDSELPQIGVSEWLRENVKKEEYVVMKAEADVVEEMISSKAIGLVDELFFECKHRWQRGKKNKTKRAYWECVALYGRLRDEGIAVHQWWG